MPDAKGACEPRMVKNGQLRLRHALSVLLLLGEKGTRVRRDRALLCLDEGAVGGVRGGTSSGREEFGSTFTC